MEHQKLKGILSSFLEVNKVEAVALLEGIVSMILEQH